MNLGCFGVVVFLASLGIGLYAILLGVQNNKRKAIEKRYQELLATNPHACADCYGKGGKRFGTNYYPCRACGGTGDTRYNKTPAQANGTREFDYVVYSIGILPGHPDTELKRFTTHQEAFKSIGYGHDPFKTVKTEPNPLYDPELAKKFKLPSKM